MMTFIKVKCPSLLNNNKIFCFRTKTLSNNVFPYEVKE